MNTSNACWKLRLLAMSAAFAIVSQGASLAAPTSLSSPVTLVQWVLPRFKNIPGHENQTQQFSDWEKQLASMFSRQHPNVTISTQLVPFDGLLQKVSTAVAAGNPPDILLDNIARTTVWWNIGALESLEDSIDAATKQDYGKFYTQFVINGHLHALPTVTWVMMLVANKTLVDEATVGSKLPTLDNPTWTLDRFMEVCRAVNKPPKQYCLGLAAGKETGIDQFPMAWFFGHGAKYLNDDRTRVLINSPEGVAALQFLVDLQKQNMMAPGAAGMEVFEVFDLFHTKRIVFLTNSQEAWGELGAALRDGTVTRPFELVGMAVPTKDGSPAPVPVGVLGTAVFKQKDPVKRHWAIEYAKFFNTPIFVARMGAALGWAPLRRSSPDLSQGRPGMIIGNRLLARSPIGDWGAGIPQYGELRKRWAVALQEALTGAKTPKQALDDFAAHMNPILQRRR